MDDQERDLVLDLMDEADNFRHVDLAVESLVKRLNEALFCMRSDNRSQDYIIKSYRDKLKKTLYELESLKLRT